LPLCSRVWCARIGLQCTVSKMIENSPITLIDEADGCEGRSQSDGRLVKLKLIVYGEPVHLAIHVTNEEAGLADIVPLARAVSDKITAKVNEILRRSGATIPCSKGCSACCDYLVPLAVPEALRLRREVSAMPAARRQRIETECLGTARRILEKHPPESFGELAEGASSEDDCELLSIASKWYTALGLHCPFLCEGACTIYEERSMACREYFVQTASQACGGGEGEPERVNLPVRMSEVLGRLASELEGTGVEGLILPLSLIWADDNSERAERTWPAGTIVDCFTRIVLEALPASTAEVLITV